MKIGNIILIILGIVLIGIAAVILVLNNPVEKNAITDPPQPLSNVIAEAAQPPSNTATVSVPEIANAQESTETQADNAPPQKTAEKSYSLEEIKNHNSASECWVAYGGKVYNITAWIAQHKAPLEKYCGTAQEFENAYLNSPHKNTKDAILSSFEIGWLK